MAVKPSSKPDWTSANPAVRTEPTGSKKNTGWGISERPPREYMNWLFFNIDEWIDYLEAVTDQFSGAYAATVGTGGTHADLNAVMADGTIPSGSRILVLTSATINTVQQITKNNVCIEFQPGVTYTKGTATHALEIQADGVRIERGRFEGFNAGGNKGIAVLAAADYTIIQTPRFRDCTLDIDDASSTTTIVAPVTEV